MFRTSCVKFSGFLVLVLFLSSYLFSSVPQDQRKEFFYTGANLNRIPGTEGVRFNSSAGQAVMDAAAHWVKSIGKFFKKKLLNSLTPEGNFSTRQDNLEMIERNSSNTSPPNLAGCAGLEQMPMSVQKMKTLRRCLSLSEHQQLNSSENNHDISHEDNSSVELLRRSYSGRVHRALAFYAFCTGFEPNGDAAVGVKTLTQQIRVVACIEVTVLKECYLDTKREENKALKLGRDWGLGNPYHGRLAELARRRQNLAQRCGLNGTAGFNGINLAHFMFDFSHRLSYCRIFKSGSSTMLTFLLGINGFNATNFSLQGIHVTAQKFFAPPENNFFHFFRNVIRTTSVRHPFRRAVSLYCNKFIMATPFTSFIGKALSFRGRPTLEIVKEQLPFYRFQDYMDENHNGTGSSTKPLIIFNAPGKEEFLKKIPQEKREMPPDSENTPTFREFVLCLAELVLRCKGSLLCETNIEGHFAPQTTMCDFCFILPDLVLKVETMDEDLRYLARLLGVTQQTSTETTPSPTKIILSTTTEFSPYFLGSLPAKIRINSGNGSCLTYSEYMEQLTGQEIDLLYTTYYRDFQLLGYEPFE